MKLRNILASFLAVAALAVGCTQEPIGNLSTIKLDQSMIVFPESGSSVTIALTATADWAVDSKTVPAEVTVAPMSGSAGETTLTISTDGGSANDIASDIVILVNGGKQKQFINFFQPGDPALKPKFDEFVAGDYWIMAKANDKWVALKPAGAEIDDDKSYNYLYSVDASVAEDGSLSSTAANVYTFEAVEGGFAIKDSDGGYLWQVAQYNNFYLTSDKSKAAVWTVQQVSDDDFMLEIPALSKWMQYSIGYSSAGAYASEQTNSVLVKLVKAEAPAAEPFEIEITSFELPIAAGEIAVELKYNGLDIHVGELPSWLSFYGYHEGKITFAYEENAAGNREATVVLGTCMADGRECEVELTFSQEGAIADVTIPQFLALADGPALYRVSGHIKAITVSAQYHNAEVTISNGSDELLLYRLVASEGNIEDLGLKEGDYVTAVGPKGSYNGSGQMAQGGYVESYVKYTNATIAEFIAAPVSTDVMYRITGTIKSIKEISASYGNATLTITDGTNDVELYRLKAAEGGKAIDQIGFAEGDELTVVGLRSEYSGKVQLGSGFYQSHATPAAEGSYTLSFADKAQRSSFDSSAQVWEQNGVKMTNAKAKSSNAVADYANPVRCYQGSSVLVEMANMTKIVFECNSTSYATAFQNSIKDTTVTVTAEGKVVTVAFASPVNSFTVELGAQVRFNQLTVYAK